ncbi:MAG: fructose-6-phosphate aldolase [Candidatus Eisenbacteria bacterium]
MKFFLDTANLEEIRDAASLGILDGVTTNPSLVSKEGAAFEDLVAEICEVVKGPVSAEVIGTRTEEMIREAHRLSQIAENVVVKIPLTKDGIRATRAVSSEGVPVNLTLCFSPAQAILAARAGAAYVSPFVGRLDDCSTSGMDLICDIRQIYDNYDFPTEIIVASVRHPMHVVEAARMGADVVTVPYAVLMKLFDHPLTDKGLKQFLDDWKKAGL